MFVLLWKLNHRVIIDILTLALNTDNVPRRFGCICWKQKAQTFMYSHVMVERETENHPKDICNDKECISHECGDYCSKHGIQHERTKLAFRNKTMSRKELIKSIYGRSYAYWRSYEWDFKMKPWPPHVTPRQQNIMCTFRLWDTQNCMGSKKHYCM